MQIVSGGILFKFDKLGDIGQVLRFGTTHAISVSDLDILASSTLYIFGEVKFFEINASNPTSSPLYYERSSSTDHHKIR